MLFNSYVFIIGFLPLTLVLYYLSARWFGSLCARCVLILASLFFYSWWDVRNLPILLGSILLNYFIAGQILRCAGQGRKAWLTAGILFDLGLLGYFKYTAFAVETVNSLMHTGFAVPQIVLPLGISFFTFTQIACLVDSYRGEVKGYTKSGYFLFVTIFPHLIAGPILYHKDMIPQFLDERNYHINYENMNRGIVWFTIGLAKKVLIADHLSRYVGEAFAHADQLSMVDAWFASFAYTLQLYFDFSGYSEMAIGLGLMLNFKLPLNFNSPYQSTSIIEFWRRWHMTLSGFLKNYLYIPLGGNRTGHHLRNIMITMLLAGLWHGAGWTFIFWGGLHGLYICINHLWRKTGHSLPKPAGWLVTFLAVNFAWVFFRAENFDTAFAVLSAMMGMTEAGELSAVFDWKEILRVIGFTALCAGMPGVVKIVPGFFKPDYKWLVVVMGLFYYSLSKLYQASEFLYFQF